MPHRAVVLLSGGIDSTVSLYVALSRGYEGFALGVRYGQRHAAELAAAARIAALAEVPYREAAFTLPFCGALTDNDAGLDNRPSEAVATTYLPGRNTILLGLALGYAESIGARDVFIGANLDDHSGYPDCRPRYFGAFNGVAQALGGYRIHAPVNNSLKDEVIRMGVALGAPLAATVTCYAATVQGLACGKCPSCSLRRAAFISAAVPDPTRYVEVTQ